MSSYTEISAMGSILQRKSRGRIWNNDVVTSRKNKNQKVKKQKGHFKKHWDED